jgi:ABC-type polysaccharide/polyol phosphate transport system ATPase subunit
VLSTGGNAVEAVGVSKRFRFPTAARGATLKDLVVRRVRREGRFAVVDALDNVTFSVGRGTTLGVIGENGSGKTTLLRILSGITRPDSGDVTTHGSIAPLLALGAGFNPALTGRENALIELLSLGLGRAEAKREMEEVIAFSELAEFIDAPVRTYSTGMAMRLAFAAAIRVDPEILLIDEVLSVGDERFATKCTAWLDAHQARGKTTIMVTHSTAMVPVYCDVALWLDGGRVAALGDPVDVVRSYVQAKSGKPIAETLPDPSVATFEAAAAVAESYRARIAGLLPLLRLPLIGYVRQSGTIKGAYEDGWTDGALEFDLEPLRDVANWMVRATVPVGMPAGATVSVEIDGALAATADAPVGEILLHCDVPLVKRRVSKIRISSSTTVNHHALGISGDVRDVGARIDEIVFDP